MISEPLRCMQGIVVLASNSINHVLRYHLKIHALGISMLYAHLWQCQQAASTVAAAALTAVAGEATAPSTAAVVALEATVANGGLERQLHRQWYRRQLQCGSSGSSKGSGSGSGTNSGSGSVTSNSTTEALAKAVFMASSRGSNEDDMHKASQVCIANCCGKAIMG